MLAYMFQQILQQYHEVMDTEAGVLGGRGEGDAEDDTLHGVDHADAAGVSVCLFSSREGHTHVFEAVTEDTPQPAAKSSAQIRRIFARRLIWERVPWI